MLLSSELPLSLWAEAINTAVYLRNRMTNSRNSDVTPYEILHGRKPDLSHLMRFGEQVYIYDNSNRPSKFSSKTIEAYMVGYCSRVNTYRCCMKDSLDIVETSDVVPAKHRQLSSQMHQSRRSWNTFLIESDTESADRMIR